MPVVALVSQKGGASKSTLATNLAVAAQRGKKTALIVDLDPQGTSEAWYQSREEEEPSLVTATAKQLPHAIARAKDAKLDWVFIDTAGRDDPATAAAIRQADFCLIPCRPTPSDLKAIPPTCATVQRLGKPFAFVLTQTPPKGPRIREATTGLTMLGSVASVPIVLRAAYQDAQGVGQGVIEFAPGSKAADEIVALFRWLQQRIRKLGHG